MGIQQRLFSRLSRALFLGLATTAATLSLASPLAARPAVLTARNQTSLINVRTFPSMDAYIQHYGLVGDEVEILEEIRDTEGYIWYRVQFEATGAEGWIREELLRFASRTIPASLPALDWSLGGVPSPGEVTPPAVPSSDATASTNFTQEQIDYFIEVALGSEFGQSNTAIRKWEGLVRIGVAGSPTAEDWATLQSVVEELNDLTEGIDLQLTTENPNIEMVFAPESEFRQYEPNYRPRNLGFFWTWWTGSVINRARILISSTEVTQEERSHLIREELTQSLGLMRDSARYSDSIFYQRWTSTTRYSDLDRAVIALLYSPEVRPGMTQEEVRVAINSVNARLLAASRQRPAPLNNFVQGN